MVQSFLTDKKNQKELTSVIAMVKAEKDLWIDANIFPVFFKNDEGDVRVALVKFDEIEDIRTNPENKNEPWLYLRKWQQTRGAGGLFNKIRREWYPDIDYRADDQPEKIDGNLVHWDEPMAHIKVNAVLSLIHI